MLDARQQMPTRALKIRFNNPTPKAYSIEVRLRHPNRKQTFHYRQPKRLPKDTVEFTLHTPMTKGEIWLDLWILEGNKVVDWHSISSEHRSWPMLEDVEF